MNKTIRILIIIMLVSLVVTFFWDSAPVIKYTIHFILDPTAGGLLNWNTNFGIVIISLVLSLIFTLIQKYTTDQKTLKELKKEQKILSEEIKKFKENPQKLMELQKKQLEFIPKTMELAIRPLMYTSIPIILFFRWFNDYFTQNPVKIFGFLDWFWAYIIFSIIFSSIFRKAFDVA